MAWRDDSHVCKYCGLPADTIDHVVPQSLVATLRTMGFREWAPEIVRARIQEVPCCRECNSALGDRVYPTLRERKQAVKRYLRRRYRRLIKAPLWTDEEYAEMGPDLGGYVRRAQKERTLIHERLRW